MFILKNPFLLFLFFSIPVFAKRAAFNKVGSYKTFSYPSKIYPISLACSFDENGYEGIIKDITQTKNQCERALVKSSSLSLTIPFEYQERLRWFTQITVDGKQWTEQTSESTGGLFNTVFRNSYIGLGYAHFFNSKSILPRSFSKFCVGYSPVNGLYLDPTEKRFVASNSIDVLGAFGTDFCQFNLAYSVNRTEPLNRTVTFWHKISLFLPSFSILKIYLKKCLEKDFNASDKFSRLSNPLKFSNIGLSITPIPGITFDVDFGDLNDICNIKNILNSEKISFKFLLKYTRSTYARRWLSFRSIDVLNSAPSRFFEPLPCFRLLNLKTE